MLFCECLIFFTFSDPFFARLSGFFVFFPVIFLDFFLEVVDLFLVFLRETPTFSDLAFLTLAFLLLAFSDLVFFSLSFSSLALLTLTFFSFAFLTLAFLLLAFSTLVFFALGFLSPAFFVPAFFLPAFFFSVFFRVFLLCAIFLGFAVLLIVKHLKTILLN